MAANVEWEGPMTLTSPYGNLALNAASGDRYLLIPQSCDMGAALRVTKDPIPQADGSILHRRFEEGYEARLALQLWRDDHIACDSEMRSMLDTLNKHVRGLLNAGDNQGRLVWSPSGAVNRMLDDVRLLERLVASVGEGGVTICTFAIDTQFPYAQDEAQTTTTFLDGISAPLNNTGSVAYYPVWQVQGPFSTFIFSNLTTGEDFVYSGQAVPGASYAEVDTFRNTIYLITGGVPTDNLKSSVVVTSSDFWPLEPGTQTLEINDTDVDVLWAPAWT